MKELQRKQRIKRLMYSWPALLALLALAVLLVQGSAGVVKKQVESASRVRELESTAADLRERSRKLEENIGLLDTEKGIVEEIREKFNVSGEGEHVAVIVDEEIKATSTERQVEKPSGKWWKVFGGLWGD